jgi:dTMP kinase
LQEVHPKLSALLYACDRFEFFSKHEIKETEIWIFDRYVYSNVAHQCTRSDDPRSLRKWIENIEFKIFDLPKPDLVLFMDTDAETAQEMVSLKHSRDYTNKQFDLHEADLAYLASVQKTFENLSDELNWQKIPCVSENGMRSIDDIFQDIITAVRQIVLRDVE